MAEQMLTSQQGHAFKELLSYFVFLPFFSSSFFTRSFSLASYTLSSSSFIIIFSFPLIPFSVFRVLLQCCTFRFVGLRSISKKDKAGLKFLRQILQQKYLLGQKFNVIK
jgi:hypothetical protein